MADKFSEWIYDSYNLRMKSDKVKFNLFRGFVFEDLLLLDSKGDTLFYVEELKLQTKNISFSNFDRVYIQGIHVNFRFEDDIKDPDFSLISSFFETNKSANLKAIFIDNLIVNNAKIDVYRANEKISFKSLDLLLKECKFGSKIEFNLDHLKWHMHGGSEHQIYANHFSLSEQKDFINGFKWISDSSCIEFDFSKDNTIKSSVIELHKFQISKEATNGILHKWPKDLEIHGSTVIQMFENRLWSDHFLISSNHQSIISGAFQIENWNSSDNWNIQLNADTFNLSSKEWKWLDPIIEDGNKWREFGSIESNLYLKGSLKDMELSINMKSDQGRIQSDINIEGFNSLKAPVYNGSITFSKFNLGSFLPYQLGKMDASIYVSGKGLNLQSFDTDIKGNINSIEFLDYNYQNLTLDGRLQYDYFKGQAIIDDKNLEVDFSGEIDFSSEKPVMDFVADVVNADLVKLNLFDKDPVAKFSSLFEMNIVGDKWSNIVGNFSANHTTLETSENYYHFNDILFRSEKNEEKEILYLSSDFADGRFEGNVEMQNIYASFIGYLSPHFPLLKSKQRKIVQNFNFDINLKNTSALTEFIFPRFTLGDGLKIYGDFNNDSRGFDINIQSPTLGFDRSLLYDVNMYLRATKEDSELNLFISKLDYDNATKLEQFEFNHIGHFGDFRFGLGWLSPDSLNFDGIIRGETHVDNHSLNVLFDESEFYFADTLWSLSDSSILQYLEEQFEAELLLHTSSQKVALKYASNSSSSLLDLNLFDFEINNLSPWISRVQSSVDGSVGGRFHISNNDSNRIIISDLITDNLILNGDLFGALDLVIDYDEINHHQNIQGQVRKDSMKSIDFSGIYFPMIDSNNFYLSLDVKDFNLHHLQSYLRVIDDLQGIGSGSLNFHGAVNNPEFYGEFFIDDVRLEIPYLDVSLSSIGNSTVSLSEKHIEFNEFDFEGFEGNNKVGYGDLKGELFHDHFRDFILALNVEMDSLLTLNTDIQKDESYYGKVIASGDAIISGPTDAISIDLNVVSDKGTELFIPLDDAKSIAEDSFIQFVGDSPEENKFSSKTVDSDMSSSKLKMDMDIELNTNAQINIILDESLGDKLTARGNGFLNLGFNNAEDLYIYGDYTVSEGDYLFTLQNFVNKKFEIEKGAKLVWNGHPYNTEMDFNALYNLNTRMSLLSSDYNRTSDVECRMYMTGDLMKPDIEFDIQIPNGDDLIKRALDERTNTKEKMTQEFLSLLVFNNFRSIDEQNPDIYLNSTISTGTEMLNNQLSNWLSQTSDRFDLGVKYQPNLGDSLSNREFELLLNNMKVNDRITFNGNIGMQPLENTTRFIGDFKFDYQLGKSGKFRLIAFRNLEESFQIDDDENNYTMGFGVFYKDEFDDFNDLRSHFRGLFKRKKGIH